MNRCSPVEMRKNLELVDNLKLFGIDFVAIPVKDSSHKNSLMKLAKSTLDEILNDIEQKQDNESR